MRTGRAYYHNHKNKGEDEGGVIPRTTIRGGGGGGGSGYVAEEDQDKLSDARGERQKLAHHLRAALNDKEVQLGELRSQHSSLLARSKKWDKTLKLKDLAIRHLRQALEDRDIAFKRHEKLIEDTKQRLVFQGKCEKAQIERKELEIASLKAKNIQQAEKLAEQAKLITALNRQREKREQQLVAYLKHVKSKVENLTEHLQSTEASLQKKEEELEAQERCCNDLKLVIYKKERVLQKIRLVEEQLQYALKRKGMVCEALEAANHKIQEESFHMAKSLKEVKREFQDCEAALQQDSRMQKHQHQIHRLEIALCEKESTLHAKTMELQASHKERKRCPISSDKLIDCADYLDGDLIQLECRERTTNQEDPNRSFKLTDTGCSSDVEDVARTSRMGTPWLCQNHYKHGKILNGSYASEERLEKGRNVSSSGRDLQDLQFYLSNAQHTQCGTSAKLELDPEQSAMNTTCYPSASRLLARSSKLCFQVSGSNAQDGWVFSQQSPNLAAYDGCMETKGKSKDTLDNVQSNTSLELQSIQEEIKQRERSWKQIEASMRAELSRRMEQLHKAEREYDPFFVKVCGK